MRSAPWTFLTRGACTLAASAPDALPAVVSRSCRITGRNGRRAGSVVTSAGRGVARSGRDRGGPRHDAGPGWPDRKVTMRFGDDGDTIEISGASRQDVTAVLQSWATRHEQRQWFRRPRVRPARHDRRRWPGRTERTSAEPFGSTCEPSAPKSSLAAFAPRRAEFRFHGDILYNSIYIGDDHIRVNPVPTGSPQLAPVSPTIPLPDCREASAREGVAAWELPGQAPQSRGRCSVP